MADESAFDDCFSAAGAAPDSTDCWLLLLVALAATTAGDGDCITINKIMMNYTSESVND
jgi:hypothetical protein